MARSSDNTERFARAALGYSGRFVWQRAGTDRRIVPLLREALARLDERDSIVRTRLLSRLAGALRDEPTLEQRDQLSAEAVAMAYRIGDASTAAYTLTARATAIWGPDSADEQVLLGDEIARFAEEANEPDRLADALWIRFEALLCVGRGGEVRAVADMHERLSEEVRQPSHRWYSGVMRTIVLLLEGQLERAEVVIETTHAAGERAQSWDAEVSYLMALTLLRREQGRLGEVERPLADALSQYPGYRLFRCLLCLVYLETGRVDDADADCARHRHTRRRRASARQRLALRDDDPRGCGRPPRRRGPCVDRV